jgi:hypothetical protein
MPRAQASAGISASSPARLDAVAELATEELGERPHGEKEARACRMPGAVLGAERPARHHAVEVRRVLELAVPRMRATPKPPAASPPPKRESPANVLIAADEDSNSAP